MIRKLFHKALVGIALCALLSTSAQAATYTYEKFNVSRGTRTAFGGITVNYGMPMQPASLKTYDNANWGGAMLLDFGFFVVDGFAIIFNAVGMTHFTHFESSFVSLGLGGLYVFQTKSVVDPYVQASFKANWQPPAPTVAQVWSIGVAPQVGVLLGLNKHVALDFGIQANFAFPLGQTGLAAEPWVTSAAGLIGARISI